MQRPSPQFIQDIASSKRSVITEDQAALFAALILQYQNELLKAFKLNDLSELDLSRHEEARALNSYKLLLLAGYACGFVCQDLDANFDLVTAHQGIDRALGGCDLEKLRHYVHTLFRSERVSGEHGSPIIEACKVGALSLVAAKLKNDDSLREVIY